MTTHTPSPPPEHLKISKVNKKEEIPYNLLLLADPCPEKICNYLKSGDCYVGRLNERKIGVVVVEEIDNHRMEIRNIAISEAYQNLGYGKQLLNFIILYSRRKGFKILRICTGNSSIAQLALYQKTGFNIIDVQKDYFLKNYKKEIWENGIRCKHLIVLEMEL